MASFVAPVPSLFVPQSAPPPEDVGFALPMDWEDVSVKDEPPDVPPGLPGELTAMNDDFEDTKNTITVNSLGEVHYLPAGCSGMFVTDHGSHCTQSTECMCEVVTDGVTVKVEDTSSDMDPFTISRIKEEDEEAAEPAGTAPTSSTAATCGTVATSDLSYLDDPRWYMSPEDKEIDPESSYAASSEVITVEPRTLVSQYNEGVHSSSDLQAGAVNQGSVPGAGGVNQERVQGVSETTKGKAAGAKHANSIQGVSKATKGKTAVVKHVKKKRSKVSVENLLPCVVQLCQVHHCGVDCRCTVKAPYPAKLKAVTISTEQNVMSLSRFTSKGSHKKQQTAAAQTPGSSNMLMSGRSNMTSDRTGLGKRQVKPSNKLKLYMEERHKKATKKETSVKNNFVCPICEKGFSYIFSFKQHIITHDVTEILNMNLPPKSKTILPTGQAGTGQAETEQAETGQAERGQAETRQEQTGEAGTGQEEKGQAETVPEETGQAEMGQEETAQAEMGQEETAEVMTTAGDSSASAPARYKTLRTLLLDEAPQSAVDTECQQQVSALLSKEPSSPPSKKISPSKKTKSPSKKTMSPGKKTRSPASKLIQSPSSRQTKSPANKKTESGADKKSESASSNKSESASSNKSESASSNKSESASSNKSDSASSNKTGVVLKVPKFKPTSQQQQKKRKATPPAVEMSGSLGLGEVVMYERGMKINEATFNVKDSTRKDSMSPVVEQPSVQSEVQQTHVEKQQATVADEQPQQTTDTIGEPVSQNVIVIAPINETQQAAVADQQPEDAIEEPISQNVIVIAPINDFSPRPGVADCRDAQPTIGDTGVSPQTQPIVAEKPVKRLKTRRAKAGLKVKLNIKQKLEQKLAAIKKSPSSDKSSPPPLIKRSPSRAKTTSSPTLQLKTSPKSSPRAKAKVAALKGTKGEKGDGDDDSDATAPYGDDDDNVDDDRDIDYSDDDDDYVPSKKGKQDVLGRSASMMRWMKQFSIKRSQQNTRYRGSGGYQALGKKKDSARWSSKRGAAVANSATLNITPSSGSRRGQSRSLGGSSAHNNNNNNQQQGGSDGDLDSGIDLESDGSEQKKSPKKVIIESQVVQKKSVSDTAQVLQMLDGKLVSRKELWVCVQARLDGRRQKEGVLCPMCDKEFHYPSALKRHVMMHTDEREFQCPECPKAFSRKPHLTEHIRVHTGERPFKCTHCPAAFAQRTNLKIHNRTHTGARPFKCPECGKRFRRQDAHTQHILTHHSKVKPYKCSECSAAFPCARYLKDHLRVHSTERPFKCEMCPAAFVCKKYLLLHVRALHLNERPFCCKLCPAKFAQSGKLTEHNRVHTGERPYKCSSCGASFSRSGHLRRHLLTHTGVRPHQCTHCEASFSQQDHLKRHVKNIHRVDA